MKLVYLISVLPLAMAIPGGHKGGKGDDHDDHSIDLGSKPSKGDGKGNGKGDKMHPCDVDIETFEDQSDCLMAMYKDINMMMDGKFSKKMKKGIQKLGDKKGGKGDKDDKGDKMSPSGHSDHSHDHDSASTTDELTPVDCSDDQVEQLNSNNEYTCLSFTKAKAVSGNYSLLTGEYYASLAWVENNEDIARAETNTWSILLFKEFPTRIGYTDNSESFWNPTYRLDGSGYGGNYYLGGNWTQETMERLVMYN